MKKWDFNLYFIKYLGSQPWYFDVQNVLRSGFEIDNFFPINPTLCCQWFTRLQYISIKKRPPCVSKYNTKEIFAYIYLYLQTRLKFCETKYQRCDISLRTLTETHSGSLLRISQRENIGARPGHISTTPSKPTTDSNSKIERYYIQKWDLNVLFKKIISQMIKLSRWVLPYIHRLLEE